MNEFVTFPRKELETIIFLLKAEADTCGSWGRRIWAMKRLEDRLNGAPVKAVPALSEKGPYVGNVMTE